MDLKKLANLPVEEAKLLLDLEAQRMKNAIICAPNLVPTPGSRVIYVANDGDDANFGMTPDSAVASLARVAELLSEGTTVLFRRGDHFRGRILIEHDNVTFSAYGEGVKPILDSSRRNFADPSIWSKTDAENVWVCSELFNNAGLLHFDPSYTYGEYNELYGHMKLRGYGTFMTYADLKGDLDFFNDREDGKLYLYSEQNPGERFFDIEIGEGGNTIGGHRHNVTIDNLWIMHTGSHGVGSGTTKNRVVQNCVFSWLGGSMLGGAKRADGSYNTTRYGNAVEIYGGCDGYRVENNWMYQIYDTAVTHQYGGYSEGNNFQENVLYKDNLMEYCFWSIEFYNGNREGTERYVRNIYMCGNYCRLNGYGWGCKGREGGAPMFCGSHVCDDLTNFVVENNIFYHTTGYLVQLQDNLGARNIVLHGNAYIQEKGTRFMNVYGQRYIFDDDAAKNLAEQVHEDAPVIVFMKAPANNF